MRPKAPLTTVEPLRRTIIDVNGVRFGGENANVIAGPCSVETEEQIMETAAAVKASGAVMLRGGAYKPRTSPYDFQGLGLEGLRLLKDAGEKYGLPIVTEVMSEEDVEPVAEAADMIQIGARNMQNFSLLKRLAKCGRPLLLKRGPSATVDEWIGAAEYLLHGGNPDVVLCERGIKTFDHSLRNTLDLASVALVKELTHLPVIVDPSHATGKRSIIAQCARAAIAIGADGVIVEVHPRPDESWSDAEQALSFKAFDDMVSGLKTPLRTITQISY